ncbi:MAG: deoxyguanosinetriphosphate triphosphohydrolase, partial [Nitrospirota bacterium]
MPKKTLCIREESEEIERKILSPKATLSCNTKGREKPEEDGEIRTCFQRDRDR